MFLLSSAHFRQDFPRLQPHDRRRGYPHGKSDYGETYEIKLHHAVKTDRHTERFREILAMYRLPTVSIVVNHNIPVILHRNLHPIFLLVFSRILYGLFPGILQPQQAAADPACDEAA